jgi:hypothetical protein
LSACKLCGMVTKLASSHIIPRSFYQTVLGHPSGPARIISSVESVRPKRSPAGEYDPELLCVECEASLSPYDDYAHELLVTRPPDAEIRVTGELLAYRYTEVDIEKLRIFFITLIWRMHATQREMFTNVSLGRYSEAFRVATLEKDSRCLPELDIAITKFDTTEMGLLGPSRLRLEGVNGYRFAIPGYSIWAKIDRRNVPPAFSEIVISNGAPIYMLAMDFRDSPEFRAMLRLVKR